MEVLRPGLACVAVKIIFEKQERRGRKKKNWNKRGEHGREPRPAVNFSCCMRLKFFHFAKSNRHRERDRPMDETTEAKKRVSRRWMEVESRQRAESFLRREKN